MCVVWRCSMNIPNVILQQLGGNKFLAMTGAKNLVGDGNTEIIRED